MKTSPDLFELGPKVVYSQSDLKFSHSD